MAAWESLIALIGEIAIPRSENRYHVFDTAVGYAAIAWSARGISRLRLPAPTAQETEHALLRRLPDAVPEHPVGEIANVIANVGRYFAGEHVAFDDVLVDLREQEPFFARVYDVVRKLRWGETTTYGAIAKALGAGPEAARDVGQAMARNPVPLIIPCHRVTAAGGKIGGFSAPGGAVSKARMLELEGVAVAEAATAPKPTQAAFGF